MHRNAFILWAVVLTTGCGEDDPLPPPGAPPTSTTPPPEPTVAQSTKANVRFKRSLRLRNDFAQALALPENELCFELGEYSCIDRVHGVALGGTAAYTQGIYEPVSETGATAPLVVERVALSACAKRVDLDLASKPQAVIFVDLSLDAHGKLEDPKDVTAPIERLYQRFLLRNPRSDELDGFATLYDQIVTAKTNGAAREWAVLSCFAVATSIESLFY